MTTSGSRSASCSGVAATGGTLFLAYLDSDSFNNSGSVVATVTSGYLSLLRPRCWVWGLVPLLLRRRQSRFLKSRTLRALSNGASTLRSRGLSGRLGVNCNHLAGVLRLQRKRASTSGMALSYETTFQFRHNGGRAATAWGPSQPAEPPSQPMLTGPRAPLGPCCACLGPAG